MKSFLFYKKKLIELFSACLCGVSFYQQQMIRLISNQILLLLDAFVLLLLLPYY